MADAYSFHSCEMEMNNGSMDGNGMKSSSINNNGENIQPQDCCSVKVIDSKVKDNYIPNISEKINHVQFIAVVEAKDISGNLYFSNKTTTNYIDTSPPKFGGSPLYLTNSIFLI